MQIFQIIVKEEERGTSTGFEAPVVMAEIAKIININVDYRKYGKGQKQTQPTNFEIGLE